MSQNLWVEYKADPETSISRVSVEGCEVVDDFIKELKMSRNLVFRKILESRFMDLQEQPFVPQSLFRFSFQETQPKAHSVFKFQKPRLMLRLQHS